MIDNEPIVNKVANSGLITLDLENHYPKGERVELDIRSWLFQDLILKEKDFRMYVKEHDWAQYAGKHVAVYCSVDAIIPSWAYMLIGLKLAPVAKTVFQGTLTELEKMLFHENLRKIDVEEYRDKKVVIKGCGDLAIPDSAYMFISSLLSPVVASLMYGEPCSTVPLYKRPRK